MDIFRDYFTRENLVRSLAQAQYIPGRLGELGLFETVGLTSTNFAIEIEVKNGGRVLTPITRGGPRTKTTLEKRSVVTFTTDAYGDDGAVYADEVLNSRGAGTQGQAEVMEDRRNRLVQRLRRNMDFTHESLRMASLLSPASTEFGAAAAPAILAVQTDATKTRAEIFTKIITPIEAALDGLPFSGIHVLCSDGYWTDLIENKQIRETYLNYQAAAELRNDPRQAFTFGNVTWERYRGTATVKIADNEAVAFPLGTSELFWQAFAPNDTMESVGAGALGQPYYMGSEPVKDAMGTKAMQVAIASFPKMVCGRPTAIRRLTKA